jgi:uncharacterized membrane protein YkvA (DUF1232 family)
MALTRNDWRRRVEALKTELHALALACGHPGVPWYTKALALLVVAYALSPIDLIPDFIPVVGYLDDLLLLPLGIALVVRTVPPGVLAECRERARRGERALRTSWRALGAGVVVTVWLGVAALVALWVLRG